MCEGTREFVTRSGNWSAAPWPLAACRVLPLLLVAVVLAGCGSDESRPAADRDSGSIDSAASETPESNRKEPAAGAAATESEPPPATPEQIEAEEAFQEMIADGVTPEEVDSATDRLLAIGAPAAPVLARKLQSDDPLEREMAATMLVLLGADAELAKDQLIAALTDDSDFVRVNAATALAQMEGTAAHVIPIYQEFLTGDDAILRKTIASNLMLLDAAEAKALLPQLREVLKEDDREIQIAVVEFLGRMGPDAAPAVEDLKALADSEDGELNAAVTVALAEIEPPAE